MQQLWHAAWGVLAGQAAYSRKWAAREALSERRPERCAPPFSPSPSLTLSGRAYSPALTPSHTRPPLCSLQVRDNEVKAAMAALGVHCQSFSADILREPWEVLDPQGHPYTCFESFWAA